MTKWLLTCVVAMAIWGCSDSPSGIQQRQDAALKDPFNYSPYQGENDVSGGGIGDLKKGAFKRDVNSVLNP
jgi:hypothetical protein